MICDTMEPSRILAGTADDLLRDGFDNTTPWLRNRGCDSGFLIGRGWSATEPRLRSLGDVFTCAINNYPRWFEPDVWITGDPPHYFGRWIWENPHVRKFTPHETARLPCPKEDSDSPTKTPLDYPNVHFYHHTTNIDADRFFETPYAQWGTTAYGPGDPEHPHGGVRSSMIATLRILYDMGLRTVYLLGCDFTPHEHPDEFYFSDLAEQLAKLKPVFDEYGFKVIQTNPDSHLRVFPIVPFSPGLARP